MAIFNDGSPFNPVPRPSVSKPRGITLIGIPSSNMGDRALIKHSNGVDGILAKLFNLVCLDISNGHGISPLVWNRLTSEYIALIATHTSTIDRMSIRGNLNKAFRKSSMTWNVFCKGMIFLKYRAFKVTVIYKTKSGEVKNVCENIHFLCQEDLNLILPPERRDFYSGAKSRMDLDLAVKNHKDDKPYAFGTDATLANLFASILANELPPEDSLNQTWRKLVRNRVEKTGVDLSKKKKTHRRGNTNKAMIKDEISWKVFCEGLQILEIAEFAVVINGVRMDKSEYESIIQTTFAIEPPANQSDQPEQDNTNDTDV